ncbi:uncharacterized protein LOC105395445 [Plutella xylostella]|uniref:uncharacterized protein LOC105395445 n=1 Tax=Plutella xylostella TaxID=51655 RepID=UPI0020331969|nr:uncharacterized protein LOC105395445 [Plutella xylostella]
MGVVRRVNAPPTQKTIVTKQTQEEIRSDPNNDDQRHGTTDLRLASWNVRSLNKDGALYQLTNELTRHKINIAALQEVRWPGQGECELENGAVLFYSGNSSGHHINGTGFIANKDATKNIIRFDAISERLCVLRVKSRFSNITIVNAYAPTESASEEAKDIFYDELESVYDQIPEYDTKVVLGDMNAMIGKEEAFVPTIGKHSKHDQSNDNGIRLINFASSKSMVVKSTMFPHKDIHKGTWKSPDGRTVNQIDHILVDLRHKSVVEDVRAYRGPDCGSDHYMLGVKMRAKIKLAKKHRKPTEEPFDTEALKDLKMRTTFKIELGNRFKHLQVEENIDSEWAVIKATIKDTALKVLGKRKKRKRRKWWTDKCDRASEEKRHYRLLAEQDEVWKAKYEEVKKATRNTIRKAKKEHLENLVKDMEALMNANATRKFYQELRSVKKGYQPTSQFLEDSEGNLVTDEDNRKDMWLKYFQELLNCPPVDVQSLGIGEDSENQAEVQPPSIDEVVSAITRLKNNKCPGIDNITAEVWKHCGNEVQARIHKLILKIWETERQPDEWNVGVICPIHKKGSRKRCSNYRGIALLPTVYKILSYILLRRLEPYAEETLGDYQCGFRRNRSTVDQIFLLKQLMEKKWEYAQDIHALFVDFTKAYDSVDREILFKILLVFKMPRKLVSMIKVATGISRMRVKVDGDLTDAFSVVTGLKQGDALSPALFNLVLEYVIQKVLTHDGGVQLNGQHKVIGYADDLALLGESEREVQEAAKILEEEAHRVGLRISTEKTEYLHMTRHRGNHEVDSTSKETSKTVVHEDYKYSKSKDNDVAVLVLPTSMSNYRSSSVQPAVIPPGGYVVPDNASVVAVRWGQTDMKCIKSNPLGLRHVGLRTVDRDTCGARWGAPTADSMLCAALLDVGGAGICTGDSGGPLVYNEVVVGVTTFSMTCDDSFYPQVFTRVSSYTNWINNTVSSLMKYRNRIEPWASALLYCTLAPHG